MSYYMKNYLISEAIGDIAGSVYEGKTKRIKDYDNVKLFGADAHFTDDTVLTFAEIYQMIKPLGLNERALKSIEDVTNPCLNSINEKCARIRSAFVSRFDDNLVKNYYIFGWRGFEKKISLDRKLVIWE